MAVTAGFFEAILLKPADIVVFFIEVVLAIVKYTVIS